MMSDGREDNIFLQAYLEPKTWIQSLSLCSIIRQANFIY